MKRRCLRTYQSYSPFPRSAVSTEQISDSPTTKGALKRHMGEKKKRNYVHYVTPEAKKKKIETELCFTKDVNIRDRKVRNDI